MEIGAVAYVHPDDHPVLPPPGERAIQRAWLAGFGAAWCEDARETPCHRRHASLSMVLAEVLGDRPDLLHELLSIPTHTGKHWLH